MRDLGATPIKTSSAIIISRELALAADRSLWANDLNECAIIISQIYDLYDGLEHGLKPTLRDRAVAAETAAWIGDRGRYAELLGGTLS